MRFMGCKVRGSTFAAKRLTLLYSWGIGMLKCTGSSYIQLTHCSKKLHAHCDGYIPGNGIDLAGKLFESSRKGLPIRLVKGNASHQLNYAK